MYLTYETMAFDKRIDTGVAASDSTAPLERCAFIVMTALRRQSRTVESFHDQCAKLRCGKGGQSRRLRDALPTTIRRSGQ